MMRAPMKVNASPHLTTECCHVLLAAWASVEKVTPIHATARIARKKGLDNVHNGHSHMELSTDDVDVAVNCICHFGMR